MSEDRPNPTPIITSIIIGIAVVWAATTLGGSFVRGRADTDAIKVTGSARKEIKSDFVIWASTITYRAPQVTGAYQSLKDAGDKAMQYMVSHGLKKEEIKAQAITTRTLYEKTPNGMEGGDTFRAVQGYELQQKFEVSSNDVDRIEGVSRSITDLIATGVPLESQPPQYIYTKLGEVKIEILADAAKDARRRAEEIAKASGGSITGVRAARMSPLQISPVYEYNVATEGQNDTASRDKAITAIVTMTFGVR